MLTKKRRIVLNIFAAATILFGVIGLLLDMKWAMAITIAAIIVRWWLHFAWRRG